MTEINERLISILKRDLKKFDVDISRLLDDDLQVFIDAIINESNKSQKDIDKHLNLELDHQKEQLIDLKSKNSQLTYLLEQKFSEAENQTIAFQLGQIILNSFKSFSQFLRMPSELIKLRIEAVMRKSAKGKQLGMMERLIFKNQEKKRLKQITQQKIKSEPTTHSNSNINHYELQIKRIDHKVKIACIMDEFTFLSFNPEAELLQLTPDGWEEEIKKFQPDMLFIESAWQGKDSLWKTKVSQFKDEVKNLLDYCSQHKIRSMFWNKEDPVHFGTFLDVAKNVNVVFTTDIDCIEKYKTAVGHDDVYLLPFAAQPKIHNPLEIYKRKDKFNFAGSFYLKYPERQRDFVTLANVACQTKGLDIYDRNYHKPHPHYTFPDNFKPFILGSLPASEIDKAYKGYVYGINMNTIKQSQSMFARRVFEMLASNTVVISNYSRGVRNFFGDLVLCSDNASELNRQLDNVLSSEENLNKFRLEGVRKVLSEHTYAKRLAYIASKLKLNIVEDKQKIVVIAKVETQEQLLKTEKYFVSQTCTNKLLFVLNQSGKVLSSGLENIALYNNVNEMLVDIQKLKITHLAFFAASNYYGNNYLLDMSLSYEYIKYLNTNVVTKATYYKVGEKGLVSKINRGETYTLVSSFNLSRSMLRIVDNHNRAQKYIKLFIDNPKTTCDDQALSIDEFNYLDNYTDTIIVDKKYLDDKSLAKDYGVDLENNLLPQSENIKAKFLADKIDNIMLGIDDIKSNHKLIKCIYNEKQLNIHSKLDAKQHRYITLADKSYIYTYTNLNFYSTMDISGDIVLVVDFYNINDQQISFESLPYQETLNVKIPKDTHYYKVYLRIKGQATVVIKEFKITYSQEEVNLNLDAEPKNNTNIVTLSAKKLEDLLIKPASSLIKITYKNNQVNIISKLAETKHAYFYLKPSFTRDELNLVLNSEFQLISTQNCDFRIVFEFQDENKQKISHSINSVDGKHALAIPMECKFVRIGFKITGSGDINIKQLDIGTINEEINCLIAKSDTLVLAKQYPSYDDLYKYGFLHTRLKTYKQHDNLVDMYRITLKKEEFGFREFEGIDLVSNNAEFLDNILDTGQYKRIFVHILDKNMWQAISKYQNKLDIYIWVHGAEAQLWPRRAYEFARLNDDEITRQKKLSDYRKQFWNQLVKNKSPRIKFIFVSNYSKTEFEQDIEVKLDSSCVEIIHNYIDNDLFVYQAKHPELRKKILSIRPFSSLTYANDLTVKTILELSKHEIFKELEFMIVGNGELFDETIEPVKHFDNVKIHKGFLNHKQIASLHKEYGVFLVPTRMDSQGVSRDEAMSSGLVPITNKVAAIPEFIDEQCGILVDGEDYIAMAKAIQELSNSPHVFKKLSNGAADRVRQQSGFNSTVLKEINMIFKF